MSTGMIITISFFAVAVLVGIVIFTWVWLNALKDRHAQGEKTVGQAPVEGSQVRPEKEVDEHAGAQASAALAEAEVKAARTLRSAMERRRRLRRTNEFRRSA